MRLPGRISDEKILRPLIRLQDFLKKGHFWWFLWWMVRASPAAAKEKQTAAIPKSCTGSMFSAAAVPVSGRSPIGTAVSSRIRTAPDSGMGSAEAGAAARAPGAGAAPEAAGRTAPKPYGVSFPYHPSPFVEESSIIVFIKHPGGYIAVTFFIFITGYNKYV